MAKINKKIKKTLNMYPVVRNQPHYPSGYDGTSTPKRRKQLAEFISEDGTFLPKSVLHADLDRGMLDFVKDRLRMTVDGKPISIVDQILTTQRWAEFSNTWSFSDKDVNPEIPFLVTVRNPAVQYGSNPSLTYTIPDRRTFHYAKVPTWDGQRKGMDLYKIPQPVPVDITYDLKIVCNRMRELNNFNKVMMQTFTSRQAYTFVKGHYIPIILNTLSDESQIGDNEKRKFYTQNYTLQLQGFLIDEEEFEITPAITRKLLVFETDTKTKKKNMEPVQPPPTINCPPESGIGMYLSLDTESDLGFLKVLIRMEYQGDDEFGKPTYGYTLVGGYAGATLNYDYDVNKWKFVLTADNTDVYYSDTLISSNWDGTASPGTPSAGFTTCGYPILPVYCIDAGETGLVQPGPAWFESQDENTEVPPIWAGFALTFIWLPVLVPGGPDGWYLFNEESEGGVEGGSINELPLGEVPLGEGSVTVSAGACEF
jgi:hypothetical protein